MKRKLVLTMLVTVLGVFCVPSAWSQMGEIKGTVKDTDGNPMGNIQVQLVGTENGRKYNLKTNKNGEFFSLGIGLGKYNIKIMKDGKQIYELSNFPIKLGENPVEINLEKEEDLLTQEPAAQKGLTPEQRKQLEEALEAKKKAEAEALKVKGLNEKIAQANAAEQSGNLDQAIAVMQEAVQLDGTREVLWSKLAEYERVAGSKTTDAQQRAALSQSAVEHYQKAIDIAGMAKPAEVAAYYNNMGQAYSRINKVQEASEAYKKAAQMNPAQAGQFYFNLGALLTNSGKVDEAIAAFDQAIAADPNNADAYYWKGVNMVGKATLKGDKMEAPPGTDEAFNKYLELQPTGQFAEPAKQMLASIGAEVQTSFGKPKAKAPAKKR
jgi:tetratricopeptide (TPR) repeat protein